MSEDYRTLLAQAASEPAHFRGLTFTGATGDRLTARLVFSRGSPAVAVTFLERGRETARTLEWSDWVEALPDYLARDLRFLHVRRDDGDWHVKVTRKGHVLMTRGKPSAVPETPPAAGPDKDYLLTADTAPDFLRSLDALDDQGRIRPSMQAKYRQINGFLNLLKPMLPDAPPAGEPFSIVDAGCGSAHLSFAVFHYLARVRGWEVRLTGIDRNADLAARNRLWQERLGWSGMSFPVADLAGAPDPGRVDLLLSLHACDSATDLALARGVEWKAALIVSAPCCQHELHHQLEAEPFRALLRHGILRERLADLVTDSLRAATLRRCGYSVKVMEFASAADTARNILIRAKRTGQPPDGEAKRECEDLKAFWKIEPEIERLLKPHFLG